MVDIVLDRVTKRFGDFTAVDAIDTRFPSGRVTCLLGPSGCGKTTLMRMIAGLETVTEGRILVGDTDQGDSPPRQRDIGMVFQYPVMYPTLTAAENIAEPLRHDRRFDAKARAARVDEMLDVLDMRDMRDAFIGDLSLGLRQKVAVGRAVARQAQVVLFDEPTTNVEVHAKLQLIRAIKQVASRLHQTIVYVTHDQTEAMTLGDEIALMQAGRIVQQASPRDVYAAPQTRFAGWFIGSPGMNELPAELRDGALVSPFLQAPIRLPGPVSGTVSLGVRPEWMTVGSGPATGEVLDSVIGIGGRRLMTVQVGDSKIAVKCAPREAAPIGSQIAMSVAPDRATVFVDGNRLELTA